MGSYFRDFYRPTATQRPTVGDTKFSVFDHDHMGWLKCDGSLKSVTDYNFLFQVIGYKFGGSGSQFALPDARGRVPGAVGQAITDDVNPTNTWVLGDLSGTETHQLTINEIPAHTHGSVDVTGNDNGDGITDTSGAHVHGITDPGHAHSLPLSSAALVGTGPSDDVTQGSGYSSGTNTTGITVNSAGAHHHKIGSTGGGDVHNNIQPTIFIGNMFIFSGKVRPTATNYYPYASGLTPPLL